MTHRILVCLSLAVGLCLAAPAATAQSRQHQRVLHHLNHPECQKNPRVFDGTNVIVPPAQMPGAIKWFLAYNKRLKQAIAAFKRLPSSDRRHPRTRTLQKRLYDRQQYGKAAFAALKAAEPAYNAWAAKNRRSARTTGTAAPRTTGPVGTGDRARAACRHFGKNVIKAARHNNVGQRIMRQFKNGDVPLSTVAAMKEHRAVLERVAKGCAEPIAKDLPAVGACVRVDRRRQQDPRTWCQMATKTDDIMAGFARNYAADRAKWLAGGVRADQVNKTEGWISTTKAIRYADIAGISAATRAKLKKDVGPVLAAGGVTGDPFDDPKLLALVKAGSDKTTAKIDGLAPGLETPRGGGHYSANMAARRVKKRLGKGARVIKKVRKGKWTVKKKRMKNRRTGAVSMRPSYRYASGYILTKVKGDKWCQLRQYTVYEYSKGTWNFRRAKAKDVTLGYVRFQKCR